MITPDERQPTTSNPWSAAVLKLDTLKLCPFVHREPLGREAGEKYPESPLMDGRARDCGVS